MNLPAFGLIGYPLGHSFSPEYFNAKFIRLGIQATYTPFELKEISEFPTLLENNPGLRGLNVTIPHKKSIIPYLDELDPAAEELGAVNCIDIRAGKLKGYNTDVQGFEQSLKPLIRPHHLKALILGTGGASMAVQYVLRKSGIGMLLASRIKTENTITYEELQDSHIAEHTIIINTTPLGMAPDMDKAPDIPYRAISSDHLLFDLIYNPRCTLFLKKGLAHGASVKNGEEMWLNQAEASWEIWNL